MYWIFSRIGDQEGTISDPVEGVEIKKILRSPFDDQLEKYSHQMQIFSRQFVSCKWRSSGQVVFCAVAKPWNSGKSAKFTKVHKIPQNSVEIWNLSWNFVTETCKHRPKTTRRRLCCENLGTSYDVKGFAIGSFLERIVVERANDDLC